MTEIVLLSVRTRDQQDRQAVEDKHKRQINFCAGTAAFKFLPGENSPQGSDHGRGLPDCIGDRESCRFARDHVEHRPQAPDDSTEQTEEMAGCWGAEEASEANGFSCERLPHEVDIPNET